MGLFDFAYEKRGGPRFWCERLNAIWWRHDVDGRIALRLAGVTKAISEIAGVVGSRMSGTTVVAGYEAHRDARKIGPDDVSESTIAQ